MAFMGLRCLLVQRQIIPEPCLYRVRFGERRYRVVRTQHVAGFLWKMDGCLHAPEVLGVIRESSKARLICANEIFPQEDMASTFAKSLSLIELETNSRFDPSFQVLTSHTKFLTRQIFGFPPGSIASSYTQLYVAFLISGLIHIVSPDPRPMNFFLCQATAITIEDAIIALAKRAGLKKSMFHRLLGYAWVYFCLLMTMAPWVDVLNVVGMGEYDGILILGGYRDKWRSKINYPSRSVG
jgi:Membrane bound O-acyl transferase family